MIEPEKYRSKSYPENDPNLQCLPLKSLSELIDCSYKDLKKHDFYWEPLRKRSSVIDKPKTLVCHDMKGGYLEDRFHHGTKANDKFYFIHWSMVDIFVYFSHNFVTIPPCSWISAAHVNGVKILGTFITEWDAGSEMCDSIFSDIETVHKVCLQLVMIAKVCGFDGWLINIENKLTPNQVPLLEEFVKFLTLKMHERVKGSLVIWYDSVIQSGELKWQNELNELNRNFFHACDGIFLNYNWNKENLKKSVEEAGSRKTDVFVGVDVFGRGCLGGGGFSTDIAVKAAREFDLSVSIFAPAWVHESLGPANFKENQYRFWNTLVEFCPVRETEKRDCQSYYTSFCAGFGEKMFDRNKIKSTEPWYRLGIQQPQPSFHYTNCSPDGGMMTLYNEDAFYGGGCLKLTAKNTEHQKSAEFETLDKCDIKVALVLSMFNGKKSYDMNLVKKVEFCEDNDQFISSCLSCGNPNIQDIAENGKHNFENSWQRRNYKLHCHVNEKSFIKRIRLRLSWRNTITAPEVSVLLGELEVSPRSVEFSFSYKDLNVAPKDEFKVMVECVLEWPIDIRESFMAPTSFDLYTIIDGVKNYICTTFQQSYIFKDCLNKTSDVGFLLVPKEEPRDWNLFDRWNPVALKVPLYDD